MPLRDNKNIGITKHGKLSVGNHTVKVMQTLWEKQFCITFYMWLVSCRYCSHKLQCRWLLGIGINGFMAAVHFHSLVGSVVLCCCVAFAVDYSLLCVLNMSLFLTVCNDFVGCKSRGRNEYLSM